MASKKMNEEDNRDVFEKALDERYSFSKSREQRALDQALDDEEYDRGVRSVIGGAAGFGSYLLARKVAKKLYPRLGREEEILIPIGAFGGGVLAGRSTGSYPLSDREKKLSDREKKLRRRKQ